MGTLTLTRFADSDVASSAEEASAASSDVWHVHLHSCHVRERAARAWSLALRRTDRFHTFELASCELPERSADVLCAALSVTNAPLRTLAVRHPHRRHRRRSSSRAVRRTVRWVWRDRENR